jgi:hypothetical protein
MRREIKSELLVETKLNGKRASSKMLAVGKAPSPTNRYDAEPCRGVRWAILFLTGVGGSNTIVLHAREGVHRISCRVAEGYGPDDATTTGPAINIDWSLGANSRPVRGGHGDSGDGRPLCGRSSIDEPHSPKPG